MSNISISLNLRQFKSTVKTLKGKSGDINCLIIPIDENHLIVGDKGVYANLQAWELKEKKEDRKDTHLVKQSFPKEHYESLSDEEKREIPIMGNLTVWEGGEQSPNESTEEIDTEPDGDELPF